MTSPHNRLGLPLYVDTNFAGDSASSTVELRELDRDRLIRLARTDTLDTELGGMSDAERREGLLDETARYPEALGPFVLDHSRLSHAVVATDDDQELIDNVFALLFPRTDRYGTSATSSNKLRDAMHVATTIRNGGTCFITRDRDILKRRPELEAAFNLQPMTPERALAFVRRVKARYEYRQGHRP